MSSGFAIALLLLAGHEAQARDSSVRHAPSTVAAKPSVSSFQPAMQLRGITKP